jgi:hypothetical protein
MPQQNVKLVSKNGVHTLILLHILHKSFEWHSCNLPPCCEVFNNVVTLSQYCNILFNYKIILIYRTMFMEVSSLDCNCFDGFLNFSVDVKIIWNILISCDIAYIQACTTPITKTKMPRINTADFYISM